MFCLSGSMEHDGTTAPQATDAGWWGGDTLDTQVKGKELWLSPDGNDSAVLRCQCVPGTLHVWLDQKILLSS